MKLLIVFGILVALAIIGALVRRREAKKRYVRPVTPPLSPKRYDYCGKEKPQDRPEDPGKEKGHDKDKDKDHGRG